MTLIPKGKVWIGVDLGNGEFEELRGLEPIGDEPTARKPSASFTGVGELTVTGTVTLEPYSQLTWAAFMASAGYPMPVNTERESAEQLARVLKKDTPEA